MNDDRSGSPASRPANPPDPDDDIRREFAAAAGSARRGPLAAEERPARRLADASRVGRRAAIEWHPPMTRTEVGSR